MACLRRIHDGSQQYIFMMTLVVSSAMEVVDAIRKRRSVRAYQKKEVPREILEEVLNAARVAPSAKNKQDWKFIVVDDEAIKEKLFKASYDQEFIKEAPVILAGVSLDEEYVMACGVPSGYVDLAIALDHISLAAVEKGIGTCWIGHFHQQHAKEILGVPDPYGIVALMTMGYPREPLGFKKKDRKHLDEIVCHNVFTLTPEEKN